MTQIAVQPRIQPEYFNKNKNNKQQSFKGFGDVLTAGLQACDTIPMLGVSVVDLTSTIIPRTAVDAKTGPAAAAETFRRESSGLVVNCLTPSLFVLGMAKLLNKPIMKGFNGVDMSGSWANQDSINKFAEIYSKAVPHNKTKSYVAKILANLEGFGHDENGVNGFVSYSKKFGTENFKKAINMLTDTIDKPVSNKQTKSVLGEVYKLLVDETKAAEVIRFKGDEKAFSSGLADLLRDSVDLGRKFVHNKEVVNNLDGFKKAATKMVNTKSLMGLGIVLPVAMSMQAINRYLTRKKYNVKGAPIYKDFGKGKEQKEMTPAEKSKFFGYKCLAAAGMVGLAVTSMMKKPSLKMLQFKGMFPTVDQTRWIATATIASRFFASEDKNELREAVVRDMTVFAGLYFLGDYVAKAAATLIEKVKPDVKLINRLVADDKTKSIPSRLWNWVKEYKIKSFDEVATKEAKNLRSVCQLANIGFAIAVLGILIPIYNRKVTNKKIAKEKEAEAQAKATQTAVASPSIGNMPKAFTGFEKYTK